MPETKKFRKKPVVIEAYQTDKEIDIETLEGTMHGSVGDWIITGVNGERYPCKPDIFEKTYEPAEEDGARLLSWEEIEYDKVYWMDQAGVAHPWPVAFPEEQDDPYKMEDYYGETYEIANIGKYYRIWSDKPDMKERKIWWNV